MDLLHRQRNVVLESKSRSSVDKASMPRQLHRPLVDWQEDEVITTITTIRTTMIPTCPDRAREEDAADRMVEQQTTIHTPMIPIPIGPDQPKHEEGMDREILRATTNPSTTIPTGLGRLRDGGDMRHEIARLDPDRTETTAGTTTTTTTTTKMPMAAARNPSGTPWPSSASAPRRTSKTRSTA